MKRIYWVGLLLFFFGLLSVPHFSMAQPESRKYLFRGTQGEIPSDVGDETTKANVGDNKELGGKCIKVDLRNSIGVSKTKISDWKPYTAVAFDLVAEKDLNLIFTIRHAKTKDIASRVDHEFQLKPGKNTIQLNIADLKNNDKSAPDLENIVRWYIALDEEKDKAAVIYLGDVWLEGGPAVTADTNHIKSDPARLARIKANKMPAINEPVMFNTPEADAICSALEVFPANNPWNLIVEDWPVHPNSQNIINSMGAEKPLRYNPDMGFILVPPDQKKIDVQITPYAEESDKGPYPVPGNVPIEGWPAVYRELPKAEQPTLDDIQRDKKNEGGDRHAIVLDPTRGLLYEFFVMKKTTKGWTAESAAMFDLKSNKLRPDGWTSADAAGLPIFPAVVRYDELQRGVVEHALRVTVVKSRKAYVYPATHYASKLTDENLPRMGERLRLKKEVDVSKFSPEVQTILKALQRYGMFVADNGIDWAISVAPDPRIKNLHEELRRLKGSDFEVIVAPPGYEPPLDEIKPADDKPAEDKPASKPALKVEPALKVKHPVIKADLHVDDDNNGTQDGTAVHPFKTVQQAIDAAKANTVIAVAGGTYPENIKVQEKAVRLYGGYVGGTKAGYADGKAGNFNVRDPAANSSHLKGDGKDSVVTLYEAGASVVDGFLITGGGRSSVAAPSWIGGGFYITQGAPTISNNVIEKNQTCPPVKQDQEKLGGGIYSTGATLTILNNVIRNNVSGRGAGIFADGPKMVIRGNTIQNNIGVSDHGGGVFIFSPNAEFSYNRVEGNEIGRDMGYGWGGGMIVVNKGGNFKLSHNVFTGNFAPSLGSAFFVDEGASASMDHDLIYGNKGSPNFEGGVVYVDGNESGIGSSLTLNHVTIADHPCNTPIKGNAIKVTWNSKVIVKNCILWNNGGDDVEADATSQVTVTYTLSQEAIKGTGNLSRDPLFVNPAGNDYHLRSTAGRWNPAANGKKGGWVVDREHSPAIDAADPASSFRLEPGPHGGRANLGACGNTAQASKSAQ